MSTRVFFVLVAALGILQGTILPWVFLENLLALSFILWSGLPHQKILLRLFAAGLILDFLQVQNLGVTSLVFVALAQVSQVVPFPFLVFLANLLRQRIVLGDFDFLSSITAFLLALILVKITGGTGRHLPQEGKIKLER